MGKGACENENSDDQEKGMKAADCDAIGDLGIAEVASGVIPDEEAGDSHGGVPCQFD